MYQQQKVANVERRTWDKTKYEAIAKEKVAAGEAAAGEGDLYLKQERVKKLAESSSSSTEEWFQAAPKAAAGPLNSQRAYLKARTSKVDIESKVGTSELVVEKAAAADGEVKITDGVTKGAAGVGWHCKVCDCFLKDSMAYLDHINGKKHQRTLGFSMRVEQSNISDVKARLEAHKRKLENGPAGGSGETTRKAEESAAEKLEKLREQEEDAKRLKKEEKKQKKLEKKKQEEEEEEEDEEEGGEPEMDPEMAAIMGFGSFGGGTKKK